MKCEHCGHNLQLEDKFCPYCGQPNPFAQQHQKEMQHFSKSFEATKADVLEESSKLSRKTVRIAILAIMVALCAVMAFLCAKADDIRWLKMERDVAANKKVYEAEIVRLMEAREYADLYAYFDENHLSYTDTLREYDTVYSSAMYYNRFYQDLMMLRLKATNPDTYKYYSESELLEGIAGSIRSQYELIAEGEEPYREEQYTEDKMAFLLDTAEMMKTMVIGHLGVSPEDAEQMGTMTEARLTVMLEDAYENK